MTGKSLHSCLIKKCFDLFVWIILYKYTGMHQTSVNLPATGRKITSFHHFYPSLAGLQQCLTHRQWRGLHLHCLWFNPNMSDDFTFGVSAYKFHSFLIRITTSTPTKNNRAIEVVRYFYSDILTNFGEVFPKVSDRYLRRYPDAHSVRLKSTIPTVLYTWLAESFRTSFPKHCTSRLWRWRPDLLASEVFGRYRYKNTHSVGNS